METDIIWQLSQDSQLSGLIGDRLYPETGPQDGPYPCITWQELYGNFEAHMQGPSGLKERILRFTVYSRSKLDVLQIRDRLITLLHGFKGNSVGPDETLIQGVFYDPASSSFDGRTKTHYTELDFTIYFS